MYILQGRRLDLGSAQELMKASKALCWSSLYPILTTLADTSCFGSRDTCDDHDTGLSLLHMLEAFEALNLLLGEANLSTL